MTIAEFRKLALSMPEAEESAHQGHPDFRVRTKVFATLGYPDKDWGMVRLAPEQQRTFLQEYPKTFSLAPGGWGRQGATLVRLKDADADVIREAIRAAWLARAPKSLAALAGPGPASLL